MKTNTNSSERGQAIILLALAMVVLLGFTALAVDGSMVYSDRRYAQNGADASSLAGGGSAAQYLEAHQIYDKNWSTNAACSSGNVAPAATTAKTAAMSRAADNDFQIDQDITDDNGVSTECGIESITAPVVGGGTYTIYEGHYMDILTTITHQTQTSFAHFVYKGIMQNTVAAVTRIRPRQPFAFGYAIVALNKSACSGNSNGVQLRGSLTLLVEGGGVFSNGCMDVDGHTQPRIKNGTAAYFYPGNELDHIKYLDASGNIIPGVPSRLVIPAGAPDTYRIPPETYDLPVPDCSGHVVSASSLVGRTDLNGLYCVDGSLSINNSHESIGGTNVTLVFRGGRVTINGGTVNLSAPPSNYQGSAIPGVLIYMPKQFYGPTCGEVNQELKINGNAGNSFTGTILAPCSDVSLEGDSTSFAFRSQTIGWNVNAGGSANWNVIFNSNEQASKPTSLDLYR